MFESARAWSFFVVPPDSKEDPGVARATLGGKLDPPTRWNPSTKTDLGESGFMRRNRRRFPAEIETRAAGVAIVVGMWGECEYWKRNRLSALLEIEYHGHLRFVVWSETALRTKGMVPPSSRPFVLRFLTYCNPSASMKNKCHSIPMEVVKNGDTS